MLELRNLSKCYVDGATRVDALRRADATFPDGELVCISGPSGSGKTTLLHLIGGLDTPTEGEVLVNGTPIARWNDTQLSAWRRRHVGFIFQFFNLLPTLTAQENAGLSLLLDGRPRREIDAAARAALERVDMLHRAKHLPQALSGGEMQRVAVARALASEPDLMLADEPTGNLDSHTGGLLVDLLASLAKEGRTVIIVTHDPSIAARADRHFHMHDGVLREETVT